MSATLMSSFLLSAILCADEVRPSATIDGHTLRIESVSALGMQPAQEGRPALKTITIAFALEPKDAAKSFAYDLGQRFLARDAAGKEIPLGHMSRSISREPAFRLAGYPSEPAEDRFSSFRRSLAISLTLPVDLKSIASLEGDAFVSDVALMDFTFNKSELDPNVTKKFGEGEAKLFLFDESERGVEIGIKVRLPIRSRSEALPGFGAMERNHVLLFATESGRKKAVRGDGYSGSGGRGRVSANDDHRIRAQHEFHDVKFNGRPDALHVVIPQIDYPRRHTFTLNNISVPEAPAPKPKRAPAKPIASK